MADSVEIGAARVHLVVDADDYDATIARALNSAKGFGSAAEAAFDQSAKGTRRASTNLLDYVANLGRVSSEQSRFASLLQRAARQGADPTILKAALDGWNKYAAAIEKAAVEAKAFAQLQTEANRMNAEFDRQRAAEFDEATRIDQARNAVDRYVQSLTKVSTLAPELQRALDVGVDAAHIERAAAAVDEYNTKLKQQAEAQQRVNLLQEEANRINTEFDRQRIQNAQDAINQQLGVQTGPRDAGYLAEQRAAVQRLEAEYQKLGAAEAEAFEHNAAADRQIAQLQNLQATAGKTWYELQKLRNAQLGISKIADPLVDKVRAQNEAMGAGTLTAKQYEFAMRGLPAQITDIAVSLASGQPAYMVLLQQGGQLKDMFGGLKPALSAVGGALLRFINPVTIAATVLAGLAVATYKASNRLGEFGVTATRSGNFAGTTQDLLDMADAIDKVGNVTRGQADEAVLGLAKSGLLAGNNLRLAAEASANWASVTGDAVDTVSQKFEQIARDPLKALVKLNEAEHFLTEAQYDRIKALEDQGDMQEAVTEATKIYYDTVSNRTETAKTQISDMASAWKETKDAIGDAASAVGRFGEFMASAAKAQKDLPWFQRGTPFGTLKTIFNTKPAGYDEAFAKALAPTPLNGAGKQTVALTAAQTKANEDLQRAWEASGTEADKLAVKVRNLNKELANATPEALAAKNIQKGADGTFSGAGYQRLVDSLKTKPSKTKLPSGRDATQAIKDQMKAELAALQTETQQIQAQYQLRDISAADYYSNLRKYAEQERDVTIRGNNEQIAALKGKKDAERQIGTLLAANAAANEKYAQQTIALDTQETQSTRQRAQALKEYVDTLKASNEGVQRQMDAMVARVGLSDREYEQLQARNQILQQQTDKLREIQKLVDEYPNSADVAADADARRKAVMEQTAIALQEVADGYAKLYSAQADFNTGAGKAWDDWLDKIRDVSSQAKDMTDSFLDGFVSATSDSLRGIDGAYGKLLDDLYQKALEFAIKQAALKLFGGGGGSAGSIFDLFSSGGGKWGQFAHGGVPGGAGLSEYRNQIVSSPTIFPFARGGVPNVGLMGEKPGHSEAIVPLAKMPNGDLGVRTIESKSSPSIINLSQQWVIQGIPDRTTRDQMAKRSAREQQRVLQKG
jgi:lambda family phage tail tape measure protein